jgi:hypothetical protein
MPFKSKAQRRFMYAVHPEVAEKFEKETPEGAKLPERVKKTAEEYVWDGFYKRLDEIKKEGTMLSPFPAATGPQAVPASPLGKPVGPPKMGLPNAGPKSLPTAPAAPTVPGAPMSPGSTGMTSAGR